MNLLNEISSTWVGIICIAVLLITLIAMVLINLKLGTKKSLINLGVFVASILVGIFLAKPALSLFDKMFGFSMLFFDMFMISFGNIDMMNQFVTTTNFSTRVQEFKDASLGISDTLKSFLEKVFDNSVVSNTNPTTLGAVASSTMSYMASLFIVAFTLFVVTFIVTKLLIKLISKKLKKKDDKMPRFVSGFIGGLKGIVLSIALIVTFSTFPMFGISADYIGNGVETTGILNSVYTYISSNEQDLYVEAIDFEKVNANSFQSHEDLLIGSYNNYSNINSDYIITVEITNNEITMTYAKKGESSTTVTYSKYIFTNNTIYVYNSNKLVDGFKYDTSNSKLSFHATIGESYVSEAVSFVS